MTLGDCLSSIRLGNGISQIAFAKKLGVRRSHLCDVEKGRKLVSPSRAAKWASVLGYSEAQFVRLALQEMMNKAELKLTVHVEAA